MEYIKTFAFLPKKEGVTTSEFHDHWRHPHGTWGREMRDIRRYVQNHRVAFDPIIDSQPRFEGIAEAWFENLDGAHAFGSDPAYVNFIGPDEPNFLDLSQLTYLVTQQSTDSCSFSQQRQLQDPDSLWSPWQTPLCIKLFQMVLPAGESDWDGIADRALGKALGALRYASSRPIDAISSPGARPFAAIAEFWWPTLSALKKGISQAPNAWNNLTNQRPHIASMLVQAELGRNLIEN